jgi:hypothetical protein
MHAMCACRRAVSSARSGPSRQGPLPCSSLASTLGLLLPHHSLMPLYPSTTFTNQVQPHALGTALSRVRACGPHAAPHTGPQLQASAKALDIGFLKPCSGLCERVVRSLRGSSLVGSMQGVGLVAWVHSWHDMHPACGPRRTSPFHVRPVAAYSPHPCALRKVHGNLDFSPRGWGSQGKRSKTGEEKRGQRVRRPNPKKLPLNGPPNRARRAARPSRRLPAGRCGRRRVLGLPMEGVTRVKHHAPGVQAAAARQPGRAAQTIAHNTVCRSGQVRYVWIRQ